MLCINDVCAVIVYGSSSVCVRSFVFVCFFFVGFCTVAAVCVSEALKKVGLRGLGSMGKPKNRKRRRRPKKGPESRCTRREVCSQKKCTYVVDNGSDTLSFNRDDAIENNITNNHLKQRTNHESHSS